MAATGDTQAQGVDPAAARVEPTADVSGAHLRGSSLLLAGRVLSLVINVAIQVLLVRTLPEEAFGAFAYALAFVSLAQIMGSLGLQRSIGRFVAMYDEQQDQARLLGVLLLVVGGILGCGAVIVATVVGVYASTGTLVSDMLTTQLLVILIVLAPVQALDDVLSGVLGVFGRPRAIFFRQGVLGPGLRLVVVLLLVAGGYDVLFVAAGYVLAAMLGLLVYTGVLGKVLAERGLLQALRRRAWRVPMRSTLSFTLPLLSTDLVYLTMHTFDAILVGRYAGEGAVAALRVIQPLAILNVLVFSTFTLLYLPAAARLHARNDLEGLRDLYWRTALWIALLTFPVAASTVTLARPLTVALYGERYAPSATYLVLLSLGFYFSAALGFNGLTLRVLGFLRYGLLVNLGTVVLDLALLFILVPRYGALGAAIATTCALLAHNVLKQLGLRRDGGTVGSFDPRFRTAYVLLGCLLALLAGLQALLHLGLATGLLAVAAATGTALRASRHLLRADETFPRLLRWRIGRWLVGP